VVHFVFVLSDHQFHYCFHILTHYGMVVSAKITSQVSYSNFRLRAFYRYRLCNRAVNSRPYLTSIRQRLWLVVAVMHQCAEMTLIILIVNSSALNQHICFDYGILFLVRSKRLHF